MSGKQKFLVEIHPRDPLVIRDGRPFGAGRNNRVRSLEWPGPSLVAGSLRSLLGKLAGGGFEKSMIDALKALSISGPFPLFKKDSPCVLFPAPRDFSAEETRGFALRPGIAGKNCGNDLPQGLASVFLQGLEESEEDFKPSLLPSFWPEDLFTEWCARDEQGVVDCVRKQMPLNEDENDGRWIFSLPKDERTHASIDPCSGAVNEGSLFSTVALDFSGTNASAPLSLVLKVESDEADKESRKMAEFLSNLDEFSPLGGERRIARFIGRPSECLSCPGAVAEALKKTKGLRMILATDAVFKGGWRPGWIDSSSLCGVIPGTDVSVRLAAAVLDRPRYISGWNYDRNAPGGAGPKPSRKAVPAGSVYFFSILNGDPNPDSLWLSPVCDETQDNRDGFGAALWGVWNSDQLSKGE